MASSARNRTKGGAAVEVASAAKLDTFLDRFAPETARLARAVIQKMRARLPGAVELVYDKRNSLVVGFCPNERASDAINSIAVYTNWVNLYFFEGDTLPDPEGVLQGSGTMVRFIRLTAASDLDRPAVKALMAEALERANPPLDCGAKRRVIIKSISNKRPRRPA
jgi:hypothetical protein